MQIIFSGFLTCFSISMSEKMSIGENEEIEMYCCLPFSYAVKYGLIKINTERIEVENHLNRHYQIAKRRRYGMNCIIKHTFQIFTQIIFT
jgi:hypothetical protein